MAKKKSTRNSRRAGLTERQRYWLKHLRACEASGESVKSYATKHGLSAYALYDVRKRVKALAQPASTPSASPVSFAKVRASIRPAREGRWKARFPNGTVLEWDAPLDAEFLGSLLQSIARLP